MDDIKSALYSIAVISISAGVFDIFSQNGRMRKYTGFVISLIIISSLLFPVRTAFTSFSEKLSGMSGVVFDEAKEQSETGYENYVSAVIKENIEERLSVPSGAIDVRVDLLLEGSDILIEKIYVTVTDKNYFRQAERIKAYLGSAFECEISVRQKFED